MNTVERLEKGGSISAVGTSGSETQERRKDGAASLLRREADGQERAQKSKMLARGSAIAAALVMPFLPMAERANGQAITLQPASVSGDSAGFTWNPDTAPTGFYTPRSDGILDKWSGTGAWIASSSGNGLYPVPITAYAIACGSSSGNYNYGTFYVGPSTQATLTGFKAGTTAFVVVYSCTTNSDSGTLSYFKVRQSNEVSVTLQGLLLITPGANPNDPIYTDPLPARNTLYPSISATGKFVLSCEIAPGNSVTFYESPTLNNPAWAPIYKGPLNKTRSDEIFKITVGMGGKSEFFKIVVN